jgi:hypothetical protein
MWCRQHEYSLAELLDHPVLGLLMTGRGMDRRAVALLVEAAEPLKEATRESYDSQPFAVPAPLSA